MTRRLTPPLPGIVRAGLACNQYLIGTGLRAPKSYALNHFNNLTCSHIFNVSKVSNALLKCGGAELLAVYLIGIEIGIQQLADRFLHLVTCDIGVAVWIKLDQGRHRLHERPECFTVSLTLGRVFDADYPTL